MGGIPDKKAKFRLAEKNCDYASCILNGDVLYIWYERRCDEGLLNCLRKIDLNEFVSPEEVFYDGMNNSVWASTLRGYGEYLCVSGGLGAVYRKQDLSVVYVETDDCIDLNRWGDFSFNFIHADKFYRAIDAFESLEKGFDVVDIGTWEVVGHLDLDFKDLRIAKSGLCCGIRKNSNFSIYSLDKSEIVFELSVLSLFGSGDMRSSEFKYSVQDDLVSVLCAGIVVVVDLNSFSIVQKVEYLHLSEVIEKSAEVGLDLSKFFMSNVDFRGDDIVLSSSRGGVCISASRGIVRWAKLYPANVEFSGSCISGDMIFGVKDSRPVAWDRYTGEDVWAASSCLPCKSIQVGDGWLVYSQVSGHIACYKMTKPYVSPHRPV